MSLEGIRTNVPVQGNNNVAKNWVRIAFVNLSIVAILGVTMRYKIAFYLPFIEQGNLLHAHSHFAFTGWVTQILMTLMWAFLYKYLPAESLKKYKWVLIANLVSAYGMLISFSIEGYAFISILFSTLSVLVSYWFAFIFWMHLNKIKIKLISIYWFKAALLFSVLSSLGPFFLSYMMVNKIHHPNWFLISTYYFLHFQYNGWFFFACMGLLCEQLDKSGNFISLHKKIFWLFALAFLPAYFLSALWLPIPSWLYVVIVCAATAELLGWVLLLRIIFLSKRIPEPKLTNRANWIFILAAIALSIKLLLQLGSTIPSLSKLAFGFRPVVIGYLHLMFLGVISLFIVGYCKINQFIHVKKSGDSGIKIFVAGIIINEIFLMIQGLSYMNYISVPYINELLLFAAVCMFAGIFLLNAGFKKNDFNYIPLV